jgi:hypothetical protein
VSAEELRAKIREVPDFPKPGILFYDITTLLKDAPAYKDSIDLMLAPYKDEQIEIVVGMESRGFIFSAPMAYLLGAGLVPVRKLGKLPAETITVEYALEHTRDPPRRDPARPEGPHRRRPARDGRDRPWHDRAGRAAQGRGRGPRLPRRARVPQGPRPARGTSGDERHQVLTDRPVARPRLTDPSGDPRLGPPPDASASSEPTPDPGVDEAVTVGAPGPWAAPPASTAQPAAPTPVDLGRRRFFRAFAGELIQTAATVAGAA